MRDRVLIWVAGGFIAGLLIGWMVLGWVIWPVRWINADPFDLRREWKEAYITMAADSYSLNKDFNLLSRRMAGWDRKEIGEIVAEILAKTDNEVEKRRLMDLAQALGVRVGKEVMPTPKPTARPKVKPEGFSPLRHLIVTVALSLVAIVAIVAAMVSIGAWRGRRKGEEVVAPRWVVRGGEEGLFVSTYSWGDDDFKEAFNIKDLKGEIIGGCGMETLECIDVKGHDRVTAFRVWLLDKRRTPLLSADAVLMSENSYRNPETRLRLARKGEPILAEPGREFALETESLRIDGLVTQVEYGRGKGLPPKSYFTKLTVELTPTIKGEA